MNITQTTQVLIYAENAFSLQARAKYPLRAKTADGYIRYANTTIIGVIDSTSHETTVKQVLGIRDDIPIYRSIRECLEKSTDFPEVLLIGIAPAGGSIDQKILEDISYSMEKGMHIVSGMHYALRENEHLKALAMQRKVQIWDVRIPPDNLPVASCRAYFIKKPVIVTCAADAAIGKMTVGFELEDALRQKGIDGELLATGQTSIMIKGKGISIDRVIGDFMPGAVEKLVTEASPQNRFLIIEGQGGLSHPGYAPVTLALLHGGMPSHAVLVYRPQRKHSIGSKLIKLPGITETIAMYKQAALQIRVPKFIGIALHTAGLGEEEALDKIKESEDAAQLPAEDMLRFKTGVLADALEKEVLAYERTI